MAEAAAQMVLRRNRVVRLYVVADRILAERRVLRKVIVGRARDVLRRRKIDRRVPSQRIQVLQDRQAHRTDPRIGQRNQIPCERRATRATGRRGRRCVRASRRNSRIRVVNLAAIPAQVQEAALNVVEGNIGVHRRRFMVRHT